MERGLDVSKFVEQQIAEITQQVGDKKVLCALSGGVDSSVCAVLVHKAIGKQLVCIFVDTGLMRHNEGADVERIFSQQFDMNLICVDAEERFLSKLSGVEDPEQKRKIIGEEFIRVFEEEAKKIGNVDFLVQGTIYPDIVESGSSQHRHVKSHHNVGGLPDVIDFKALIEPIKSLYKDEVRNVGRHLGIPDFLVDRQPFPGPGLAVRCIGDVTKQKLDILRAADYIFTEEIKNHNLSGQIWQYFAILTGIKSVGVSNDERTYKNTIALRAVTSSDAMSAGWAKIPLDILETISDKIVNEVPEVSRVVYDITRKPPSTIEWE